MTGVSQLSQDEEAYFREAIQQVTKRDGRVVEFDLQHIINAIFKAMDATDSRESKNRSQAKLIAFSVGSELIRMRRMHKNFIPAVEGIQDLIERQLILDNYVAAAKAFILYREKRSQERARLVTIPQHVIDLAEASKPYFKDNPLGEFVYLRSYARWIPEESRRETWLETVERYISFMHENLGDKLTDQEYNELRFAIANQQVMPSMRLMQFAGVAARRDAMCGFNCSFIAPSQIEDFAEIMYISMRGTGVGFAVESQNIQSLPQIIRQTGRTQPTHIVGDSAEGWCNALTLGLRTWFNGEDIEFDFSQVRQAGARLNVMGGRASGPEPLRSLLNFARGKILSRQGKRLRNIDAHDIICSIGNCVVSGGVRRSAMISISDLDDPEMRDAKHGAFFNTNPQRMIANNSAAYLEKPSSEEFLDEWLALVRSHSGERGIFNRGSVLEQIPERRKQQWVENYRINFFQPGTNPCGEIVLQSKQNCNLTEVIARPSDTIESLTNKIRLATILGTYQSMLTNFKYISPQWQINCDTERLLGVSITGQWDCPIVRDKGTLMILRERAILTNADYADRFGINRSTAITCVKPSGTVSQVIGCSSGMHARYAPFYIRRIRISATDSLFKVMRDAGVPFHPEVGQALDSANTFVLEFPVKVPEGAVFARDLSALQQLEHWKLVKLNYTEHNPSVTIYVNEDEWLTVANWLYQNWEILGGLSFLPREDHVYQLAPYEEISEEKYNQLAKDFPNVDYSRLYLYEREDETEQKRELACSAGVCELD